MTVGEDIYKKLFLDATLDFIKGSNNDKFRFSKLKYIINELKTYGYFDEGRMNYLNKFFSISDKINNLFPVAFGVLLKRKSDDFSNRLIGSPSYFSDFSNSDAFIMLHSVISREENIYVLRNFLENLKSVKCIDNSFALSEHLVFNGKNTDIGSSLKTCSDYRRSMVLRPYKALLIPSSW